LENQLSIGGSCFLSHRHPPYLSQGNTRAKRIVVH
jgi:hypothetical protein